MMKRILFLMLLTTWSAAAQTPEELYQEYTTPETRAIMERFEQAERQAQEAEAAARGRRTLALAGAILIGLIPLGTIGSRIIRQKSWKENPSGTAKAIGTGLAGGLLLFALNYGIFLLKIKMGDAFNTTLAFILVAGIIVGSFYLGIGAKSSW